MKRAILVLVATVAVLLCGARQANADGITYTESDIATGSIGGTSFTNVLVTLTFVGDTSSIVNTGPGLFRNTAGTASVRIAGLGTFMFTDTVGAFDTQQGFNWAGFDVTTTVPLGTAVVLATIDPSFLTYDLTTGIGPITNTALINPGFGIGTAGGLLILNSAGVNSTFTATTATTPEPSSLLLLGSAIAGLVMVRRRRLL